MARIQHKNIVDSELHEMKGAASALVGSVPVASGTGTTTFQKVGVSTLAGALPTNVPDLPVATDGAGGFKVMSPTYGRFQTTKTEFPTSFATTALITPQGMNLIGSGFKTSLAGYYWYTVDAPIYVPAVDSDPPRLDIPQLYNVSGSTTVATFASGIVYLDNTSEYRLNMTSGFSLWRISV